MQNYEIVINVFNHFICYVHKNGLINQMLKKKNYYLGLVLNVIFYITKKCHNIFVFVQNLKNLNLIEMYYLILVDNIVNNLDLVIIHVINFVIQDLVINVIKNKISNVIVEKQINWLIVQFKIFLVLKFVENN